MLRILTILSTCCFLILGLSCKPRQQEPERQGVTKTPDQDELLDMNRRLIRNDAAVIRDYARRQGWNLTETGTGLFYQVLERSRSVSTLSHPVVSGDRVKLDYSIHLIDGTFCYSSNQKGPKVFVVDKSEAEQGLHQAVKLLEPGDSARLVIPPFLAFGLVGDGTKIPGRAILVYHVRLVSASAAGGQ